MDTKGTHLTMRSEAAMSAAMSWMRADAGDSACSTVDALRTIRSHTGGGTGAQCGQRRRFGSRAGVAADDNTQICSEEKSRRNRWKKSRREAREGWATEKAAKKADRKRRHTESEHQKGVKSKQHHLSALSLIRHGTSIPARSVPIPAAPSAPIEKR